MNENRIALGTVQFGLNYGINNKDGQISYPEISNILNYAANHNIQFLDTAEAYGDSENRIGIFLREHQSLKFNVVSKYNFDGSVISQHALNKSLSRLGTDKLYGYMAHDFKKFNNDFKLISDFLALKDSGSIQKIGFSLYYHQDLEFLLEHEIAFDILQIPFNIFDQRFTPYFKMLKDRGIEIHTRSCFLQGLFFMEPESLPSKLMPLKKKLARLHELADIYKLSLSALSIAFCLSFAEIDKLVIGVDSVGNLKENIAQANVFVDSDIINDLKKLKEEDEQLILPLNW